MSTNAVNSIQKHVLDVLGVQSVYCVIGASMGGMLALKWALLGSEATPSTVATALASNKQQTPYVRSLVLISTAARQGPWAITWAENQWALVIGILSDGLYPVEEQVLLSRHMPNATLALVQSDDGHDGFFLREDK